MTSDRPKPWRGLVRRPGESMKRHHRRIAAALCWMILLLDSIVVTAQQAPFVESGVEVRISSPVFTGVATAMESTSHTIWVVVEGFQKPVAVPLLTLERLERRRRATFGMRVLRGAKWGAIIGAGFGAMGIVMSEGEGPGDPPQPAWPFVGAAYFAVPRALIGMLIPQIRWEPVPLPGHVNLSGRGGAVQVSTSIGL